MTGWPDVWIKKTGPVSSDLREVIAVDGFDSGPSAVDAESWRNYVNWFISTVGLSAKDSVYEVGCGAGAFLTVLAEAGIAVGGSDISPGLIEAAKERLAGEFHVCEATEAPIGDVDVAFSNSVFQYFPDLDYASDVLGLMCASANQVAVLDVPDFGTRERSEAARAEQSGGLELYRARYEALPHLYYEREWFERSGWSVTVVDQDIPGYGNSPFRFNVFLRKI